MQQPRTDISVRTTSPNCSFHSSPQRPQVLTIYKTELTSANKLSRSLWIWLRCLPLGSLRPWFWCCCGYV